jgi:hypothetical protein
MARGATARKAATDETRELLLIRARRALEQVAREAPAAAVREAAQAPTDVGALGRLMNAAAVAGSPVDALDPLAQAFIRGTAIKRELLERAGGALPASVVADALGISQAAVHQRRRRGALLAVETAGEYLYPAVQFSSAGVVLGGLPDLLREFPSEFDGWMILSALLEPADPLDGRNLLDVLREGGDSERALARALVRDLCR